MTCPHCGLEALLVTDEKTHTRSDQPQPGSCDADLRDHPLASSIRALERGIAAITRYQSDEDDEGTEIMICDYCYEATDHQEHCPIAILQRLIEDYRS